MQLFVLFFFSGGLCLSGDVGSHHATECEEITYNISQTLWPDHCVQNTEDANLAASLTIKDSDIVVQKGDDCEVN